MQDKQIRTLQPGDVLHLHHYGDASVTKVGKDYKTKELVATVLTRCGKTINFSLRYAASRLQCT